MAKKILKNEIYSYRFFYVFLSVAFLLLTFRLSYLQIIKGNDLNFLADRNRLRLEKVSAPRGLIYDRNGRLLVDNKLMFNVVIIPQYLKNKEKTIKKLSDSIGVSVSFIKTKLLKAKRRRIPSFTPVVILKNVDRNTLAKVETNKFFMPGVDIDIGIKRVYLLGKATSHVIGYIGKINKKEIKKYKDDYLKVSKPIERGDTIGKFGLEKVWDKKLRGANGSQLVLVDANGRKRREHPGIFDDEFNVKNYVAGDNLYLTIDASLQMLAYEKFKNKKGAVVVIKVDTGEILTMLSTPSFDPNVLSIGTSSKVLQDLNKNPFHPFYNKTIQNHYSPGSTFKPFVLISALEKGINPNFHVNCKGKIRYGRRHYHCWKKTGHGKINFHDSIVQSCDTMYYKLGQKLGIENMYKYAKMFGIGQKTGINLPHEVSGLMPNSNWKYKRFHERWMPGENLTVAIGQSYDLVTPLQLANAYAGIASGKLFKPLLVKKLISNNGEILYKAKPELKSEINISKETQNIVIKALYGVMHDEHGTAKWYKGKDLDIAGKTGTVQLFSISAKNIYKKCSELPELQRHHGWFVGFAPYDKPEIAVAVIAEHSCHGSSGAAPIVRDIVDAYKKKYGFKRDMDNNTLGEAYEKTQ